MKTKIATAVLIVAAILAWTGMAGAQTATPTPKVQLPSGETVWDLSPGSLSNLATGGRCR